MFLPSGHLLLPDAAKGAISCCATMLQSALDWESSSVPHTGLRVLPKGCYQEPADEQDGRITREAGNHRWSVPYTGILLKGCPASPAASESNGSITTANQRFPWLGHQQMILRVFDELHSFLKFSCVLLVSSFVTLDNTKSSDVSFLLLHPSNPFSHALPQ